MKLLIARGANLDARDADGKGLMDYVSDKNKAVLVEMLAMQQANTVRRAWLRRHRKPGPAL